MDRRWSKLIVAARTSNALDFTKYDRSDPSWELCEMLVLNELEDQRYHTIYMMHHQWHSSLANTVIPELFEIHEKGRITSLRNVGRLLLPWRDWGDKKEASDDVDMYRRMQERKSKDPELQKKLKEMHEKTNKISKENLDVPHRADTGVLAELRHNMHSKRGSRR